MSRKELRRVEVLGRVASRSLRLVDAQEILQLSYRQTKRLWKRYREEGADSLQHRSAGRPSHHVKPAAFREQVLQLLRTKYSGGLQERFGPTLAAEHLAEEDGLRIDAETLRRWMLEAGLWAGSAGRNARIASGVRARSILGNWYSWMAAFTLGSRNAVRKGV